MSSFIADYLCFMYQVLHKYITTTTDLHQVSWKKTIGGSIHLTIANMYIARYLCEVNEWNSKLKIGKAEGHEENKHEEKIKKDQESVLPKNKAVR